MKRTQENTKHFVLTSKHLRIRKKSLRKSYISLVGDIRQNEIKPLQNLNLEKKQKE